MKRIVLLRHGESLWNQENRFTGWTDVDLSEKGVVEACKAGDTLREAGFSFEIAYTSYLKRRHICDDGTAGSQHGGSIRNRY